MNYSSSVVMEKQHSFSDITFDEFKFKKNLLWLMKILWFDI